MHGPEYASAMHTIVRGWYLMNKEKYGIMNMVLNTYVHNNI